MRVVFQDLLHRFLYSFTASITCVLSLLFLLSFLCLSPSYTLILIFNYASMWRGAHERRCPSSSEEDVRFPGNWSILAVVRHLTEMLGTKLRSSVGTARALNPRLGYGYFCDET